MRALAFVALLPLVACQTTGGGGTSLTDMCGRAPLAHLAFLTADALADFPPNVTNTEAELYSVVASVCADPSADPLVAVARALTAWAQLRALHEVTLP